MAFETLDSQTVFRGRVFDVHRDKVRYPDGREVLLDVVAHHGAVTLIPINDEGEILFIRQYRHPAGRELLELPAGVVEEDEPPEAAAGREIREETGMGAHELEPLGEFFLAPGYSTEYMHVFLARNLYPAPLEADEDELLSLEKIPLNRALQMAEEGQFQDAKTLAALLLLRPHVQHR